MPRKYRPEKYQVAVQMFKYQDVDLLIKFNRDGFVSEIIPVPKDRSQISADLEVDLLRAEMEAHHWRRFSSKPLE